MPGVREWLLILAVILLVFGATKLPQLGDGLGRAIKNFKRAISSGNEIEVAPKQEASEGAGKPEAAKPATKVG
jgi:sec-independent protein translocase protein TatA